MSGELAADESGWRSDGVTHWWATDVVESADSYLCAEFDGTTVRGFDARATRKRSQFLKHGEAKPPTRSRLCSRVQEVSA